MVLRNQKGITLIEMIIFIIVAAVAIPAIVGPVLSLLKESTKPEKSVTANFLGQKILEVITANDFPTLTGNSSAPDSTEHSPPPPPSGVVTDINNKIGSLPSGYTKDWDIYYIEGITTEDGNIVVGDLENEYTTAATDYVRIDITVTDPDGRDFNYYSIVTKRVND